MVFREVASFEVVHAGRAWPWIAFAAGGDLVAFAASATTVATRRLEGEHVAPGPTFSLPADVQLAAFSVSSDGNAPRLAIAGVAGGAQVVAVLDSAAGSKRVGLDAVLGAGHELRALAFDRTGRRLWLSAESATETVIALVDAGSLALVGAIRSAAFPRPALHEIHLHPQDDAILLLAACGEEGTFARVVGFAGDEISAVPGALDSASVAAGFVGFSADGARVHLAEADELRTHAWPMLLELSSVQLDDDFVSSFSGAVVGGEIFVDGEIAEEEEDAVMLFDRTALHGVVLPRPAPIGMWAGRLGASAIVTVESKGDPVRGRVLVVTTAGAGRPVTRHLHS
jgi:hypothetical protein